MLTLWTTKEKHQLLEALRKHGTSNLQLLAKEMPNKTVAEIKYAITLYTFRAKKTLKETNRTRSRKAPIDKWIYFLRAKTKNNKTSKALAIVMKMFARQSSHTNSQVNFRSLYLFLADLMVGCAPRKLDKLTNLFLLEAIGNVTADYKEDLCSNKEKYKKCVVESCLDVLQKQETNQAQDNDADLAEKYILKNPVLNPLRLDNSIVRCGNKDNVNDLSIVTFNATSLLRSMENE